ncbi:RNA-guided endonuclease IscB [Desulfurobacterium thermolithotrophum]|uniref:RNA-guided endonuclease IscB n=1 Tax=Desulfurobacterium thermolithotrophum TaxID=64160 RepID=UPI003984E2EA
MLKTKQTKVFVVDAKCKPLIPTNPIRARLLLKRGKARVYRMIPFTIQLNRTVNNPAGEFTAAVDDGAKWIGIAVKGKDEIVFTANVRLRQDVSRKVKERAMYRRNRRSKLRYRPERFLNRRRKKGWLPPSIRYRKEVVLRVLNDLKKLLNITKVVIEQVKFDISSIVAGRKLARKEYQQKRYEGKNFREKVLKKDNYTCQICGGRENLEAHHIIPKSKGGTNLVENGITLCKDCHRAVHEGRIRITANILSCKAPSIVQQGKLWLYRKLKEQFEEVKITFGYVTKRKREELRLPKDHYADACAMLNSNRIISPAYLIIPRRRRPGINNPTKKHDEYRGFRHFDLIVAYHRTKGKVIGCVRSLKNSGLAIRTKFSDNFVVGYTKSKLLWRPKGLVYVL